MVTETEVKEKTDSDLLEIWANQNDYVAEMMTWVKSEIERRNLDTSGVYVFTAEEKKEAVETSSRLIFVHILAFFQAGMGLLLMGGALLSYREQTGPEAPIGRQPAGQGFELGMFAVGALLIVFAVGVWRGRRWAFTAGAVIYSLVAAFSIFNLVTDGLIIFGVVRSIFFKPDARALILDSAAIVINGTLATVFNALRKRATE